MNRRTSFRLISALLALGLIAAACGDSNDGDGGGDGASGALSGTCPSTLIVQTDWWPESEHGAVYEMIGDDYSIDANAKSVTGSLTVDGGSVDTGIDIEVRAGGPAVGFSPPRVQMYTDTGIHLGYSSNDGQVAGVADAPTLAVVAPLERNPQIVMWDPATYPDIETVEDIGEAGITVNVFGGGTFPSVFVAQGIWSEDQVDPSYDGTPARFISENGNIAQQGFASAEPYNYENVFEEWSRPVKFQMIHDAGFQIYSQPLAIRSDDLEDMRPCLQELVPIIQQAAVDFSSSPDRANAIIIDTVAEFDAGWVYTEGVANFAVEQMRDVGMTGNGPDDTVGNFDMDRVQAVIDAMRNAGMDVPADLSADDLVTNEFIDESIGH